MIWRNPWAWAGLLLLAGPLLVHLLARRVARVQPFPTLRFLQGTRLVAVRRSRLTDTPLLALRMSVLFVATAAVAQPFCATSAADPRAVNSPTRLVLVDTSASMLRAAASGETALAVARREAHHAAADARRATLVETAVLADAVAGGAALLQRSGGRRELVVVSDFQVGAVDSLDLAAVPAGIGVRLIAVPVDGAPDHPVVRVRHDGRETTARTSAANGPGGVVWEHGGAAMQPDSAIVVLAGAHELDGARAAHAAASATTAVASARGGVTFVFPGHPDAAALRAAARVPDAPWMTDVIVAMRRDPVLRDVTRQVDAVDMPRDDTARLPAASVDQRGEPLALAGAAVVHGRDALVLFPGTAPHELATAALMSAALQATAAPALPLRERQADIVPAEVLQTWQRPATAGTAGEDDAQESHGRWLWLASLMLLALEGWLRRNRRVEPDTPAGKLAHPADAVHA